MAYNKPFDENLYNQHDQVAFDAFKQIISLNEPDWLVIKNFDRYGIDAVIVNKGSGEVVQLVELEVVTKWKDKNWPYEDKKVINRKVEMFKKIKSCSDVDALLVSFNSSCTDFKVFSSDDIIKAPLIEMQLPNQPHPETFAIVRVD